MANKPKDFEYFSCKMDKEIAQRLNRFCEATGLSKTKAVEKALDKFIAEYDENKKI